jgi:hypothetical protein
MGWIVGLAVGGFLVWLVIRSPGFRKAALGVLILLGVGIAYYVYLQSEKQYDAITLIKPSEIALTDVTMDRDGVGSTLKATVRNTSMHALESLSLHIKAFDCPGQEVSAECDTIGDQTVSAYVPTPPGQVRSISEYVFFANMPKARNFKWTYAVTAVRADVN